MSPAVWRQLWPLYLAFVLAFPAGMAWVETRQLNGPIVCAFRVMTHLDCPSCGLTRAFRAMGRLQVSEAFGYNPLGPLVFLVTLGAWIYAIAMLISRGRLPIPVWWPRWRGRLLWWTLAIYLLVGIGRMTYQIIHPEARPSVGQAQIQLKPPASLRR